MGTDGGCGLRGRYRKRDRNRVEDGLEKIQPDHDVILFCCLAKELSYVGRQGRGACRQSL